MRIATWNIGEDENYIFKVNVKLVKIRFLENSNLTAEDCLTNVLKNLYR